MSTAADENGSARTAADGTGAARAARGQIGLIWAQARGGVIGAGGTMPWHLPEDLRHFSRTTKGSPVVMGRRTWESFPPAFRPLPGRTNIVITRDNSFAAEGAIRARDLPDALRLAREGLDAAAPAADEPTIWVIGGGRVYREAMDVADLLVVTEIDLEVDGDTTAPEIPEDFSLAEQNPEPATDVPSATGPAWHASRTGLQYRILTYRR